MTPLKRWRWTTASKRLERALAAGFRWYGGLVGRRPVPFFLLPFLVTLFLAPGLFLIRYDDDIISLFTPYGAPSRQEQRVVREFSYVQPLAPISDQADRSDDAVNKSQNQFRKRTRYLLQSAKNHSRANPWYFVDISYADESNILDAESFHLMWQFVSYLYHNYSCQVETYPDEKGVKEIRTLRYNPNFCNPDDPTGIECPKMDNQLALIEDLVNRSRDDDSGKVLLTYPVLYFLHRPFNWGQFLYGAVVNSDGRLRTARVATLKLQFEFDLNDDEEHLAKQCMRQMSHFILSLNHEPDKAGLTGDLRSKLRFYVSSQWLINDEVSMLQTRTVPCIAITAIMVTIFTMISSYYARSPIVGAAEAIFGVFTIGLSLASAFSLLFICGRSFNFVITMTPLLTLCVGIDNDFLLISAWRRPYLEKIKPRDRLAYAFAEAGPSLTITSVNDILCFAVGILSQSPAIQDFCLFTCVSLTLRYLYQLTFFSGMLVFVSERGSKMADDLSRLFRKRLRIERVFFDAKKISPLTRHQGDGSTSPSSSSSDVPTSVGGSPEPNCVIDAYSDDHAMHKFFRTHYTNLISNRFVRLVVIVVLFVYLALSFYSASLLSVNISVTKLFLDQSPLIQYYQVSERFVFSSIIGNVIVTRPPDFRNTSTHKRFLDFVGNLENTTYSPKSKDTTSLWLRDYLDFYSYMAEPSSDFYDYLGVFLENDQFSKYANDLRFNYSRNGLLQIESFLFSTYYQNASTWDDCAQLLLQWRKVCANYSEFGAVVHDYFFRNSYLDQRLTLSATTLQTMGIASLSIAVVTSLLMPDATSMFFICFSSLSVDLGVIGLLRFWGSDLDPITMACLLMTIGFSIYYTARICYCYQRADKRWPLQRKLAYTLGTVGWPIFQGGVASLVGIVPLVIVPAYMVRTFFRTIVSVVFIGLLHGLVFMPVLMSLYDYQNETLHSFMLRRRKMRELRNCGKKNFLTP